MSIEIIPSGSTAVVTGATEAERVKDVLATMAVGEGQHYADTVKTVKDVEQGLERSSGTRFMQVIQDIKGAEAAINHAMGDRFIQVIQDVKDAEMRLETSAGNRFIDTIQDVKNGHQWLDQANQARFVKLDDDVKDVSLQVSEGTAKAVDATKDAEHDLEEALCSLRSKMQDEFQSSNWHVAEGFKYAQRDAFENAKSNLILFKDQALLSETLAAKQALLSERLAAEAAAKACECCCELKEAIHAEGERTRDLVTKYQVDALRERVEKAESSLAAYFSAKVAPVVPVV